MKRVLCKLTSLIMAGMMMITSVPVSVFAETEGVVEDYVEVLADENGESYVNSTEVNIDENYVNSVEMNVAKDYVNQNEFQSEYYEENHIITLSDEEYDNDELLFKYFNKGVAEKTGLLDEDYYTSNHEYIFGDDAISKRVYNDVKKMAVDILAGTRDTTYIYYELSDADVFASPIDADKWYTAQELGAASPMTNYDEDSAQSIIDAYIEANYRIDSSKVFYAARSDCPYEFFWSGLSSGYFSGYSYSYRPEDGEWKFKINAHEIFYVTVSQDYVLSGKGTGDINPSTGNRLTVDSTKISAANSAIDNAAAIVNAAVNLSDLDKLKSYMLEICNLNKYNFDVAEKKPPYNLSDSYGNPWQLIYVFDGNPSTNVVCEGYSKAFQYLCDSTAFDDGLIRCISVSGYMDDENGPHMWNVVRMPDNKNYLVDVTNCDLDTIDHRLFIVPYSSGNVNAGYVIPAWRNILYIYKPETIATNDVADLVLSGTPYVETNSVIVNFDANGGKVAVTSKEYAKGSPFESFPTPEERAGYDFDGWYTEAEDGIKIQTTDMVYSSYNGATVYAHWNAKQYTVTFDVNGGDALVAGDATKSVAFDTAYGTLPAPTKNGYDFAGWYTEATGGTKIEENTKVSTFDNHTLYAHWELASYKVSFDANGGDEVTATLSVTVYDEYGTLPVINRTGYTLDGWYTERVGGSKVSATSKLPKAADQVLFAHWKANSYRVTFNANGGTCVSGNKIVTFDSPYGELPTASREGYFFRGWFTETANGDYVDADSIVKIASDHVLYAQWDVNKYTVATPVFSDEAEETDNTARVVLKGSRVTLSCETKGSIIYYTIDGSYPDLNNGENTFLYEDAIVIDRNMTISAIAVLDGFNNSICAKQSYVLKDESQDWGDIIEEDREGFENANAVPDELWVRGIGDVDYTGLAVTFPEARVYFGKTLLVLNKDYSIRYANNKNATDEPKATVTITGKGNYAQSCVVRFQINRLDISNAEAADITLKYNGRVQKGTTTVTYTMPDGRILKLKPNVDFIYYYPGINPRDPENYDRDAFRAEGTHAVTIIGRGNYGAEGGEKSFDEVISDEVIRAKSISKVSVRGVVSMPYTGDFVVQEEIKVFDGKYELNSEEDYSIEYENNIDIGTARIIIRGEGRYSGKKVVTFKIVGTAFKKALIGSEVITNVVYDKTEHRPVNPENTVTFMVDSEETIALRGIEKKDYLADESSKRDYDYYYEYIGDTVNAGKVTVVFTGINAYTGTVKKSFKILPKSAAEFTISVNSVAYTKGGAKPDVYVLDGGDILEVGKDYTIAYSNNNKVHNGTDAKAPAVKITGKKNYKGAVTKNFAIDSSDISNADITVSDVIYKAKAGLCKPAIKLFDTNGKALVVNKDYSIEIKYTYLRDTEVTQKDIEATVHRVAGDEVDALDIIPLGTEVTANIKVNGKGFYIGENIEVINFRYVAADISKAKVSVKSQTYTGKKIVPSKDDITVTIGKTVLKKHEYDIVSCTNNVSKGKAQITIKALGNYGGTKTATFNIVSKSLK